MNMKPKPEAQPVSLQAQLKAEIEAAAETLGCATSTVGMRAGQGGKFYERLCKGHRVWPETAESVRARIKAMVEESGAT